MDRMNLQEFVRTTLVQLMQGVHEALFWLETSPRSPVLL